MEEFVRMLLCNTSAHDAERVGQCIDDAASQAGMKSVDMIAVYAHLLYAHAQRIGASPTNEEEEALPPKLPDCFGQCGEEEEQQEEQEGEHQAESGGGSGTAQP